MHFKLVCVMRYKVIVGFLVVIISCKKQEIFPILVVGHAGMGLEFSGSVYHGNSEEAMSFALETPNCDGVEMDIQMAKDGTLWLFHDESLNNDTKSTGCVANKIASELKSVHYNTIKKEKLAQLTEIELLRTGEKNIFLDIKHLNYCDNAIQNVDQFLANLASWRTSIDNPNSRVWVILSNANWIAPFCQAGWTVLFSSDDVNLRKQLIAEQPDLKGFVCKNNECSMTQVDDLKSAGKAIFLYEVRSPKALKQVRKKQPNGVMSDDLQGAIIEFK